MPGRSPNQAIAPPPWQRPWRPPCPPSWPSRCLQCNSISHRFSEGQAGVGKHGGDRGRRGTGVQSGSHGNARPASRQGTKQKRQYTPDEHDTHTQKQCGYGPSFLAASAAFFFMKRPAITGAAPCATSTSHTE
jgi:hypothetical protein